MDAARDVEVAREFLRRFGENDHEGLYELQSTVDWKIFPRPAESVVPWFGSFKGRTAAERCMAEFERTVEVLDFAVQDLLSGRGRVAAIIEARYRVKATGKEFTMAFVNVMGVQEGKIVSIHEHGDTATASRAFQA